MICGVILAAGDSERMGSPKALLKHQDQTFLEAVCGKMRAAGLRDILVVLGRHERDIRRAWNRRGETVIVNPNPEEGQASSLKLALRHLPQWPFASAALVALVDMPYVGAATYRQLVGCWRQNVGRSVIPRYQGKRGHPIVLDQRLWPLCSLCPREEGLHWALKRGESSVFNLDVDDPAIHRDVDTPEEYHRESGQEGKWARGK
ncbi:MAG: hypothetical protein A3G41_07910 [Elusimicrobia bacterium RIFCSPLOWO2_12_FULL_59_9]|nr:MAG: hypothetical protein A3G41_07910 [Elusimicrobia bacterium RIFCSPLOWO2_12_FULL_59_9]